MEEFRNDANGNVFYARTRSSAGTNDDIGIDAKRAVRSKFYQAEKAILEARGYPTTSAVP